MGGGALIPVSVVARVLTAAPGVAPPTTWGPPPGARRDPFLRTTAYGGGGLAGELRGGAAPLLQAGIGDTKGPLGPSWRQMRRLL